MIDTTQRRVAFGLQGFVNLGLAAVIMIDIGRGYSLMLSGLCIGCLILALVLMVAYWRGWRYAPPVIVALSTLVTALVILDGQYDPENALALMVPLLYAVVMGRIFWIPLVAIITPPLMIVLRGSQQWFDRGEPAASRRPYDL